MSCFQRQKSSAFRSSLTEDRSPKNKHIQIRKKIGVDHYFACSKLLQLYLSFASADAFTQTDLDRQILLYFKI